MCELSLLHIAYVFLRLIAFENLQCDVVATTIGTECINCAAEWMIFIFNNDCLKLENDPSSIIFLLTPKVAWIVRRDWIVANQIATTLLEFGTGPGNYTEVS